MGTGKVAIIMGSDSDFPQVQKAVEVLKQFNVDFEVNVLSAHRVPKQLMDYVSAFEENGIEAVIAVAGKAAHLPGVVASYTTIPVIGVPIKSSALEGMDALLSIVQMPAGIPVATVAIDGCQNSALLAVQILAVKYEGLKTKMKEYRAAMAEEVLEKNNKIKSLV